MLELKILELVPGLTVLGETFEEASDLENTHCHVLQQLQVDIVNLYNNKVLIRSFIENIFEACAMGRMREKMQNFV